MTTSSPGSSVTPLTADEVKSYRQLASMGHVGIGGKLLAQMLDERECYRAALQRIADNSKGLLRRAATQALEGKL